MEPITPEIKYLHRRAFLKYGAAFGITTLLPKLALAAQIFPAKRNSKFADGSLEITKESVANSYNNFYEFSLEKGAVKTKVSGWQLDPSWKVEISGLQKESKSFTVDELCELAGGTEERVYRFRCVEAWSMVVPWIGFSLGNLITKLNPSAKAKFVRFQTFADKKIGTNISSLSTYPWPYTEGLTLAEAKHPLTLIATGMYGKPLPKQNGAPIRLVVPWKYGFKSIKSIVRIEFTEEQPKTLWSTLAPAEYGFYANVNPAVDHPRWSQATERVLDSSFFPKRKPTLPFNGYGDDVAKLYAGLDLKKNY